NGGVDRPVLLDVVEMRVDCRGQSRIRGKLAVGLRQAAQVERRRADRLDVELPLVVKVVVKKPFRNACLFGDVLDRNVFVAARREQTNTELEKLGAALVRLQSESTASHHMGDLP